MSFQALVDDQEVEPGGFLCVNDDDDDDSGVPDRNDTDPTPNEDDLRGLSITADGTLVGTLTLSAVSGGNRIRLWENADRSNEVTLPKTWTLQGLPKTFFVTLYVEGIAPSVAARDVELRLRFEGDDGPCEDVVRLTVVQVDLAVDGLPDSIELDLPGFKVATNNDFDEGKVDAGGNPQPDYTDASPVKADGSGIAYNGLVLAGAMVTPGGDETLTESIITLVQTGGSGSLRMLATEPFTNDWVEVPPRTNLRDDFFLATGAYRNYPWALEGLSPGPVELTFRFERAGAVCEDKIQLNVVEYGVVEIRYKTFIACNAVTTGSIPGIIDVFAGDDRSFGYAQETSRSLQSYFVSVNPMMVPGHMIDGLRGTKATFGQSLGYNDEPANVMICPPGQVCPSFCTHCITPTATPECTDTASSGMTGQLFHVDETLAELQVALVGTNPCVSLAPAIDGHMVFQFRQVYDPATGALGPMEWRLKPESQIGELHNHDGFPWHEVYLNGIEVYRFDACIGPGIPGETWPGPDPGSLWPPAEISVFGRPEYSNLDTWQTVPSQ